MADRPVVILYRREGCPLCDHAMAMLQPLARRMAFDIEPIDIEGDEALHRRYVYEIPVVAFAGTDVIGWPFTPESLERALRDALG